MIEHTQIMSEVLKLEAQALEKSSEKITQEQVTKLSKIFNQLISTGGQLFFCGVGKSGHIAVKLASTFSSLGLPSFFLHPTEALHGDLGRVKESDVICFISKSGTTEEILKLIPYIEIPKSHRIALLGNPKAAIASESGIIFDCSVDREACLNNQAPTTSTTLALGMGDAMAVLYEHLVGLSKEGFAANHPGGLLGKSLRVKVKDLMWAKENCPSLNENHTLKDAIIEMTRIHLGGLAIIDDKEVLLGILVEGDIRRTLGQDDQGLNAQLKNIMNSKPITIGPLDLAFNALKLMEERKSQIDLLPVIKNGKFLGFIRLHDLLKEGFSLGS